MPHEIEFTVTAPDKIHCESCEQRIGRALQRVNGVAEVKANAATQQIRVSIDPAKITPEQVRRKLKELGYDSQLAC